MSIEYTYTFSHDIGSSLPDVLYYHIVEEMCIPLLIYSSALSSLYACGYEKNI